MADVGKAVSAVSVWRAQRSGDAAGLPDPTKLLMELSGSDDEAFDPAVMAPLISGLIIVASELAERLGDQGSVALHEIALRYAE